MLSLYDFQRLAADLKLYHSGIDGKWGPATKQAMDILTEEHQEVRKWSRNRIIMAGIQLALQKLGYNPGDIDGYYGDLTHEAYNAWAHRATYGKKEKFDTTVLTPSPAGKYLFPHQRDVAKFYGKPGPAVANQLVKVQIPYHMVLDWNLDQSVSSMSLHRKCADSASEAFHEVFKHYGQEEINRLGLNRFAGSYNHRKMRGGRSWSMHAYGCAIDTYAAPNGLRTRCPDALFCGAEYVAFFNIWEAYGWTSLGRAIGRDWMHLQAANL